MIPLPSIPSGQPNRPGASRRGVLLLAALATFALVGASDPEVVPIYVPAKNVSKWFPPGTELRRLSRKEFEIHVEAAQRAAASRRPIAPPRLIRRGTAPDGPTVC